MILIANCIDAISIDACVTLCATRRMHRFKAIATERTLIAFKELTVWKALQTLTANKVFWVPLFAERRHTTIQNDFAAMTATRTERLLVASGAVRHSFLLVKVARANRSATIITSPAIGMPHKAKSLQLHNNATSHLKERNGISFTK